MKKKINNILKFIDKHSTIFLILLTIILEMITYITMPIIKDVFKIIILILFAITLIFLICFNKSKPLKKRLFYIIYIFGVLIRINYILNTNIYTRQHDVETLDFDGHLKYIYILSHRKNFSIGFQNKIGKVKSISRTSVYILPNISYGKGFVPRPHSTVNAGISWVVIK